MKSSDDKNPQNKIFSAATGHTIRYLGSIHDIGERAVTRSGHEGALAGGRRWHPQPAVVATKSCITPSHPNPIGCLAKPCTPNMMVKDKRAGTTRTMHLDPIFWGAFCEDFHGFDFFYACDAQHWYIAHTNSQSYPVARSP